MNATKQSGFAPDWAYAWLLPIGGVIVWQLAALQLDGNSPAPTPWRVLQSFYELTVHGGLFHALIQSLGRVLAGFCIASVAALLLGMLMGVNQTLRDSLDPIVECFRPIAPMVLLPVVILWFGTGTPTALAIVGYAAFFPMLINTIHGVHRVDPKLVAAARTMGIPGWVILHQVIWPGARPQILLGARLAMGVAWTAIIAAELAVGAKSGGGGSGGIGQMMFVFYAYNIDLNAIVVCMIMVGLVALSIDRFFRIAERHFIPWRT